MKREVAWRIFAKEFKDSNYSIKEEKERAPNYVITPTGAKCNRLFAVGVLTEIEEINEDMIKAKLSDPTGMITIYAGNYQEKQRDFLRKNETPFFASVTGKARTFESDDGRTFTSVRPENIGFVDEEIRNNWLINTAERTIERMKGFKKAKESGFMGEELVEYLKSENIRENLAEGISVAIGAYETSIEEYNRMIKEALSSFIEIEKKNEKPKDVVKKFIKRIDEGDGVSYSKIIDKVNEEGFEEEIVEEAINELMEEGKCYEPEIGKLKLV